jgi:hypothetical protein
MRTRCVSASASRQMWWAGGVAALWVFGLILSGMVVPSVAEAQGRECGRGQYLSDGHCCARGTAWNGKRCLRRRGLDPICPRGTTGIYPDCQARSDQRCPSGTVGRFPNCRTADICPSGYAGAPPNCQRIPTTRSPVRTCPPGTAGSPPLCRNLTSRPCPAGTVGAGGRCVTLQPPRPQVQIRRPTPGITAPRSPQVGTGANTRPIWR